MAGIEDAHVVEIPIDEHKQITTTMSTNSALQHHPLMEISRSPGHLLLLKLWQRDEHLSTHKISAIETQIDSIKNNLFQLAFSFFLFHGLFLTILFTSNTNYSHSNRVCSNWWIPSILSISTSMALIVLTQVKVCRYWKAWRRLQRERGDGRAVTRCIQELRMKGASFDLGKEPNSGKRMKSSSVEIKWKPLTWCYQNLVTVVLLCFAGLLFPASKLVLCY